MKVTPKLIDGVLNSSPEKRYKHFVSVAADWGDVWCLRDSQARVCIEESSGSTAFPVWPIREFAELFLKGRKFLCTPERIAVDSFLSETLPLMEQSGKPISVLPRADDQGLIVSPTKLAADLQTEMERLG